MKKTILFFILMTVLLGSSYAQTDDDNIEFLRVQDQIKNGNYRKALAILDGISEQGKTSTFYTTYSAESYERLQVFDTASFFYKKLYTRTKSYDAMKKVAEMKDRQDAKMSCSNCHGQGFYLKTVTCKICKGDGTGPCVCVGGVCRLCKGEGTRDITSAVINCTSCSNNCKSKTPFDNKGNGKCCRCDGYGRSGVCLQCTGSGINTFRLNCNH